METPLTAPCVYCGNDRPIEAELCPTCGRGWIDTRVEAERRQTDPPVDPTPDAETVSAAESSPTTASPGEAIAGGASMPGQLGFDVASGETPHTEASGAEAANEAAEADVPGDAVGAATPAGTRDGDMEGPSSDPADVAEEPAESDDELVAAAAGIAAAMRVGDDNGTADEEATRGDDDLVAAAAGIAAAMRRTDDDEATVADAAATEGVAVSRTGAADTASGIDEEVGPADEVTAVTAAVAAEVQAPGVADEPPEYEEPAEQAGEPPIDEPPIAEAPAEDVTPDKISADEAPGDEAPAEDLPPDKISADEAPGDEAPIAEAPVDEPALGVDAAALMQEPPAGDVLADATASQPDPSAYDLSPLPLEEPRSRRVQTLAVVGVVLAVVAAWFVVLALITRNDGGEIEAQPPGVSLPTETTPTGDGSAAPGTTAAPTTAPSAPTTTGAPATTAATLPPTTIPQLEAVGEPLAASQLSLGGFALGPFDFGSAEALGSLVATYGQPDGFESTSVAWGTCEGDEGFVVSWGPLSAVFLGTTDASEFVAYRLGSSADHPASELTTLSGLSVGDTVADLESVYRRFSVAYEDLDGTSSFILTRDTDNATLLWGPVTSIERDGIVEGIYSPRPCDGGPEPS